MQNISLLDDYDPNDIVYCDKENRTDFFGTTATAVIGTWLTITIIAATIGNLLVILVILTNRCMMKDTNMFLLSLAVADLLVGILMSPIALSTTIKECWNLGDVLCTMNSFLNTVLLSASIHTLMYISIYKCICIHRVANNNLCPPRKWVWRTMIVFAWIWGLLFALLTTKVLGKSSYKPKTMQCGPLYPASQTSKMYILHTTNQVMSLVIPFFIMVCCYVKIYKDVKKSENFRREQNIRDKGVVKTLLVVLVCFLLCWMPYCFYTNYATLIEDKKEIPFYLNPLAYCCGYMNSACNPIIYAWRFPEFRQGYRDILCKRPSYIVQIGPDGRRRVRTNRSQSTVSCSSNVSAAQKRPQINAVSRGSATNNANEDGHDGIPESNHLTDGRDSVFVSDQEFIPLEDRHLSA